MKKDQIYQEEAIKEAVKNKKWDIGLRLLLEKKAKAETFTDRNYRDLGKCYRFQGEFHKALETLSEAGKIFPDNKRLLTEYYHYYCHLDQWTEAGETAEKLVGLFPEDGKQYVRLGRSYVHLQQEERASKSFQRAIELISGQTLKSFIAEIEKKVFPGRSKIRSKYIFLGGKNNLGMIEHRLEEEQGVRFFLTKVMEGKQNREEFFYDALLTRFPQLQKITPKIIEVQQWDRLQLVTMEKVEAEPLKKKEITEIIEKIYKITASVKYFEGLREVILEPNYGLSLKNKKSQGISSFFSRIHNREVNERLFELIHKRLGKEKYDPETKQLFTELEERIFKYSEFEKVDPNRDYSFLHGDLGKHNILVDRNSKIPCVLDWNSYKIGPKWYDAANVMAKGKLSIDEIINSFIFTSQGEEGLNNTNKILFLYGIVIIWFQGTHREKFETKHLQEAKKALEEIKKLQTLNRWDDKEFYGFQWKRKKKKKPAELTNLLFFSRSPFRKTPTEKIHRIYAKIYWRKLTTNNKSSVLKRLISSPITIHRSIGNYKSAHKEVIKDLSTKTALREYVEQFFLGYFYSITPKDYYQQGFYREKSLGKRKHYLLEGSLKHCIYNYLLEYGKVKENTQETLSLGNKAVFTEFCLKQELPAVPIYFELSGEEEELILPKEDLFIKPNIGKQGQGTEVWYYKDGFYCNHKNEYLKETELKYRLMNEAKALKDDHLLVQPIVKPHKGLQLFYNKATPTIRLITYLDEWGKAHLGLGMFRFNIKENTIIDNASVGGAVAPIELEKGAIDTIVQADPIQIRKSMKAYFKKEDQEGLTIPYWKETCDLVRKAHELQKYRMVIGWDVIVSETGPLLLEGNSQPGIQYIQAAHENAIGETEMLKQLALHTEKAIELEQAMINTSEKGK